MSLWRGLRARARAIIASRQADRDLHDEIAFHLERESEKNIALGMSPEEARRAALLSFGGATQMVEAHRDVRRAAWLEHLVRDVSFALRMFSRSPLLTGAAIVTIALGVGANTAIFSVVNAVVLRPLPFPHPNQLYLLTEEDPERGWHHALVSTANYLDWREGISAFENLAAYDYTPTSETLSGLGDSRRVRVAEVTGNLFATLGVHAAYGRTFEDAETWATTPATLVLSDEMWTRAFARSPSVIGRMLTLDGQSVRIVGIMQPTFVFPFEHVDGWVSFRWEQAHVRTTEMWRRERWLHVVGRLRPGVSLGVASAQLDAVASRLAHDYPVTNAHASASITPLHDSIVGDTRTPLYVLLGAVSILLLIACVNVANLLLVQAAGRQRELALRLALGAARVRLVRQALTESLVLSVLGAGVGAALGWAATRALVTFVPTGLLPVESFGVDATVLVYVASIAVVTGILFGIGPALWIQRRDPADVLKQASRTGTHSAALRRGADMLATIEVALALLISTGAALLVGSARQLANVDPGFDSRGVLMTSYYLYAHAYDSLRPRQAFHDELLARVKRLPGVTHAALGATPLEPNLWSSGVVVHGHQSTPGIEALHMYGSPDWAATLGIPLRAGRFYAADDRRDLSRIVVNETFARMFFAGENAVGQQVNFTKRDNLPLTYTIIGVIGDIHERSLMARPGPVVVDQFVGFTEGTVLVKTRGDPDALAPALRSIIRDMDPQIAPGRMRRLSSLRDEGLARSRFFAAMLVVFAGVGLVLATVGIYGVLAQLARNCAREMGIRIALGARPADVRWLVLRHGALVTTAGVAIGTAVALATSRVLRALLFQISPNDPAMFVAVISILATTGVFASFIPALRASRADPVDALRAD
jgi:putative ABC transport system permease protein